MAGGDSNTKAGSADPQGSAGPSTIPSPASGVVLPPLRLALTQGKPEVLDLQVSHCSLVHPQLLTMFHFSWVNTSDGFVSMGRAISRRYTGYTGTLMP